MRRLSLVLAALPCACSLVLDWDSRRDGAGPSSPEAGSPMTEAGVVDAPAGTPDGSSTSDGGCPAGMVAAAGYCIDATEVTNAAYAEFLAARVDPASQPAKCAANTSFTPAGNFTANNLPVVNVDWCDALAYCTWAGKRLCGKIGGGSLGTLNATTGSQWFEACSMAGARRFPYGESFQEDACRTDADGPVAVASKPACTGAIPGLFDMSGNVAEWEDACAGDGPGDECAIRGGSFESEDGAESACAVQDSQPRNEPNEDVGFRCCT